MLFAHDTEVALDGAAALVNTANDPDSLVSVEDLAAFVTAWDWSGDIHLDEVVLRKVRALRPRLRELWTADDDARVQLVNDMLREARALPQLVRHDHWNWHLHATDDVAPLHTRMVVEAAMAVVDLIRGEETERLRLCAATACDGVVIDLSRNRSRKYCSTACGNRMAATAYRSRRSAEQ